MADDESGTVEFEVATVATAGVVPTLRTIAADLAMRQDFDLDAVDDLRMAVDEACALLIPAAADGKLTCVFTSVDGKVEIGVSVLADDPGLVKEDALGWQLLTALATSVRRSTVPAGERYLSRVDVVRESGR